MKVQLIQPPMYHQKANIAPNLGLASIAAVLEQEDVEVQVVDAAAEGLGGREIMERIRRFAPDMIGAGGQTPVTPRSLEIFRRAKREVDPNLLTMAGGPHFSFAVEESFQECPELDFIVRGEGEETVRELCNAIRAGTPLDRVQGISYKGDDGAIHHNPEREPIQDLDSIPYPAWHLFPIDKYHWVGNPLLATFSSRGCPFRCPFCITWKVHKKYRRRDPQKIVDEMVWVKHKFGHDTFFFHDDSSFSTRKQMESFLDALERCDEKLYWYFQVRDDVLLSYEDLWQRMKDLGLFKITIGLETPDPEMRKKMGKRGYELSRIEKMLQTLEHDLDIIVAVYLMFGFPDEDEASMLRTLEYAKHLYPDLCSFLVGTLVVPFPGTEVYKELKEKDLITSYDWRHYGYGKPVIKSEVPDERVEKIFRLFWVGTFGRPKALFKQFVWAVSRNRFRRAMARQYAKMVWELLKDVVSMKKGDIDDLDH